jgi:hypothetical protein
MTIAYYAQILDEDGTILRHGYINDANGRFHANAEEGELSNSEHTPANVPAGIYVDGIVDIKGENCTEATRTMIAGVALRFGWPVHKKFLT